MGVRRERVFGGESMAGIYGGLLGGDRVGDCKQGVAAIVELGLVRPPSSACGRNLTASGISQGATS